MLPYINGTPVSPLREEKSSSDSVVDPPLSAALAAPNWTQADNGAPKGDERENPVVRSLLALRECMAATAALPVDLAQLAASDRCQTVDVTLPTLKGLRDQMRLAANLVDAVVEACEKAGGSEPQGKEVEHVVGVLLGEEDATKE
jgi:hypothetical protein